MSNRVTTYNPLQVTIALGSHIASGFADDSFVIVDPNGDGTSSKTGCDGEVVRSIDPNNTSKIKLSLLQNSKTNKFLSDMYYKDKKTGKGMFPITIKDLAGGYKFTCDSAWVSKLPSRGYGKQSGNREWELETGNGKDSY